MSRNTKDEFKTSFGDKKLSIKTLNKNKITLFTQAGKVAKRHEMISDDLKAIVKHIIKGNIHQVDEAVDLLDDIDRKILFELLDVANIDTNWEKDAEVDKNQLIHKFNVLKAEIQLGNQGTDTLKDFKAVIDECFERKLLSKSDYYRLKDLLITNAIRE